MCQQITGVLAEIKVDRIVLCIGVVCRCSGILCARRMFKYVLIATPFMCYKSLKLYFSHSPKPKVCFAYTMDSFFSYANQSVRLSPFWTPLWTEHWVYCITCTKMMRVEFIFCLFLSFFFSLLFRPYLATCSCFKNLVPTKLIRGSM